MLDPVAQRGRHHGTPPFGHRSTRAVLVEADSVLGRQANARHALAHVRPPPPADPEHRKIVDLFEDLAAIAIERKQFEERLAHQAQHDPLTGLPNRTLVPRAPRARPGPGPAPCSERSRCCSSTSTGSRSSTTASATTPATSCSWRSAGVCAASLRPGDTVARFGGDEFTVLCEDLHVGERPRARRSTSPSGCSQTHRAGRSSLDGEEQFVTASIGIALAGPATERPEELLRDADAAMYRAKERGKDRCEVFDEHMRATAASTASRPENALRRALERGELRVLLPADRRRCTTGRCVGVEALVRWQHPERGLLAPARVHRRSPRRPASSCRVGAWVLEEACRRCTPSGSAEHGPGRSSCR